MKLTLIFAGIATTMGAALPAPNTLVARDVAGTCQIPDHGLTPYNMANTSGRCYNIPFNSGANAAYVHDSYVCQFFRYVTIFDNLCVPFT